MSAFSRNSRNTRGRSNGGAPPRKPRIDSSRRPKPFRPKPGRGGSNELRAAANSVFADAPVGSPKKSSASRPASEDDFVESGHRLQKVLAAAGFGSRRQCEELIETGRVEVDGQVVSELGVRVFPNAQKIRVDGESLPKTKPTYIALNKPKNALCTNSDPQGRRRVGDLVPAQFGRLFPVGRLDQNSEGLILLTNDGALAERLTHPRFEVPKKYKVQVAGLVDFALVRDLKRGVHIAEGIVQADDVVIKSQHKLSSILEITLKEGKNREIRRMLARVGHKVMQLQRVQVGPIKLGKMAPGEFRRLTTQEVAELYRAAQVRPDSAAVGDGATSASRRASPVEISEIVRRQEFEEEEREARKSAGAKKFGPKFGAKRPSSSASKRGFSSEKRRDFDDSDRFERSERSERRPRRAERPEFREEFRSEERREDRRRVRREFDVETRTIGPRKFDRSEDGERRDRFNDDASAKRERREFGERRPRSGAESRPNFRSSAKSGPKRGGPKKGGAKGSGGGKRSRGK